MHGLFDDVLIARRTPDPTAVSEEDRQEPLTKFGGRDRVAFAQAVEEIGIVGSKHHNRRPTWVATRRARRP